MSDTLLLESRDHKDTFHIDSSRTTYYSLRVCGLRRSAASVVCAALVAVLVNEWLDPRIVNGRSMEPAIAAGSLTLVNRLAFGLRVSGSYVARWRNPRPGQVVAVKHGGSLIAKRVSAVTGTPGSLLVYLQGDNQAVSLDSRFFGAVSANDIIGAIYDLL